MPELRVGLQQWSVALGSNLLDAKTILEKVMCDSDYYHVGSNAYFSFLKELRTE